MNTIATLFLSAIAYINPIMDMDMSDPDAATVDGTNFYLTVSSFTDIPGLPIYHSTNLVDWALKGHAVLSEIEGAAWSKIGQGVWAPSIRNHKGVWHILWGDPDYGIYEVTATDPKGEWSKPVLLKPGKGLIDPCPVWDAEDKMHILHAFAHSRTGYNSVLSIDDKIVYDGIPGGNHTVEGPKIYRHNGYYWIFAPARGVVSGVQLAMRSKNLYGPYEERVILSQQSADDINGPHQGAWLRKADGSDWFLHFQDKGYLGRVLHLQPLKWVKGWPIAGDHGRPVKGMGLVTGERPLPESDWTQHGTVYPYLDMTRIYSGGDLVTKIPAARFRAKTEFSVYIKNPRAKASLVLIGDKEIYAPLPTAPTTVFQAGKWDVSQYDMKVEVSVAPDPKDPRVGYFEIWTNGKKTRSGTIKNSIWQGVKIGFKAEKEAPKEKPNANWIDVKRFTFAR